MRGAAITVCFALVGCSPTAGGGDHAATSVEKEAFTANVEQPATKIAVADSELAATSDDDELASLLLEVSSWGRPIDRISVSAEGQVRRETWDRPFSDAPSTNASFKLTKGQKQFAMNMLAPLRSRSGGWINCENMPTDGPYGSITWNSEDRLDIYMPCLANPEYARSKAAIDDFRKFITDLQPAR